MPFRLDEARSLARLQHKSHVQRASLVGCTVHLDASPSLASWPNICKAGSLTIMYKIGLCSVSLDQIALCPFQDQTNQPTCLTFLCMSCQKTGDLLELLMNHHHFLHRSGGREEAGLEFGLNSKSWASSSGKWDEAKQLNWMHKLERIGHGLAWFAPGKVASMINVPNIAEWKKSLTPWPCQVVDPKEVSSVTCKMKTGRPVWTLGSLCQNCWSMLGDPALHGLVKNSLGSGFPPHHSLTHESLSNTTHRLPSHAGWYWQGRYLASAAPEVTFKTSEKLMTRVVNSVESILNGLHPLHLPLCAAPILESSATNHTSKRQWDQYATCTL